MSPSDRHLKTASLLCVGLGASRDPAGASPLLRPRKGSFFLLSLVFLAKGESPIVHQASGQLLRHDLNFWHPKFVNVNACHVLVDLTIFLISYFPPHFSFRETETNSGQR